MSENNEEFEQIECRKDKYTYQYSKKTSKRLEGVNFIFYKEVYRTPNEYTYLQINIGFIPREELDLKNGTKVNISFNKKNPYILLLEKTKPNNKKAYTLTRSSPSKNTILRVRMKWLITDDIPEHLFECRHPAEYKINGDTLLIFLK